MDWKRSRSTQTMQEGLCCAVGNALLGYWNLAGKIANLLTSISARVQFDISKHSKDSEVSESLLDILKSASGAATRALSLAGTYFS